MSDLLRFTEAYTDMLLAGAMRTLVEAETDWQRRHGQTVDAVVITPEHVARLERRIARLERELAEARAIEGA